MASTKTTRYLILVILFLFPLFMMGQDVVTLKDGSSMTCQVLEVGDNQITFKQSGSSETMVLSVKDIDYITYVNGEKEIFGKQNKKKESKEEKDNIISLPDVEKQSSETMSESLKGGNGIRSNSDDLSFFEILYMNSLKDGDKGIWGIGERLPIEWASEGWGLDWQMYTNAFLKEKNVDFTLSVAFGFDYSFQLTNNGSAWFMLPLLLY